jgi:thiol-disulfide isomerase/thioredoxin
MKQNLQLLEVVLSKHSRVKPGLAGFFALCLLSLGGCAPEQSGGHLLVDGSRVNLVDDPRLLFFNYWAVWCAPCLVEMPELAAFSDEFSARAKVYAINFDNPDLQQLRSDIEALDVRVAALAIDPGPELGLPRPEVLPTTYLMRGGRLLEVLVGPQTHEDLVARLEFWEQQP